MEKIKTNETEFNKQLNEKAELPRIFSSRKSLFSEGKKLGLTGWKVSLRVFTLLIVSNTLLFFIALAVLLTSGSTLLCNLLYLALLIVVGIVSWVLGFQLVIRFALMQAIRLVYKSLTPLFMRISAGIVNKSDYFLQKGNKPRAAEAIDLTGIIAACYGKVPSLLRRGAGVIVNMIPIADLLRKVAGTVQLTDKEQAAILLHQQIDAYLNESLLEDSTPQLINGVLLINTALQLGIIVYAWFHPCLQAASSVSW